jgi:hypothetical protein
MSLSMRKHWFFLAPLALVGVALVAFLGGELVKLLWNWLMPEVFGVRQITFWQAFGILALARILVGGFGLRGSGSNRSGMRSRMRERMAERIGDRVGDRWDGMTPEERERFRQRVRERCGFDPGQSDTGV